MMFLGEEGFKKEVEIVKLPNIGTKSPHGFGKLHFLGGWLVQPCIYD